MPGITVQFKVELESYAALTIEAVAVSGSTTPVNPTNDNTAPLTPPPSKEALIDVQKDQSGNTDGVTRSTYVGTGSRILNIAKRPWIVWFDQVYRSLRSLLDVTVGVPAAGPGPLVVITAYSVDETDIQQFGNLTLTSGATTVTPVLTGTSRFGKSLGKVDVSAAGTGYSTTNPSSPLQVVFTGDGAGAAGYATVNSGGGIASVVVTEGGAGYTFINAAIAGGGGMGATLATTLYPWGIGQYFLINDPTSAGGLFSYEACQITAINIGTGQWTIARGQLGTPARAHTGSAFYRIVPGSFSRYLNTTPAPQRWKFVWDNMCVVLVQAQVPGGNVSSQYLVPLPAILSAQNYKPYPGLRTMGGAAYIGLIASGDLSVGQTANNRAEAAQAWETVRTVYARVRTAPTGASIIVWVCFINQAGDVGLLDRLEIADGALQSFDPTDPPDMHNQMPYHNGWPTDSPNQLDWPPAKLPKVTSGLDMDGNLVTPVVVDPTQSVFYVPDGEIDFMIDQVGSGVGGANLTVVVQT